MVIVVNLSTNLADWTAVATLSMTSTPVYFGDRGFANVPQQFYRLRDGP